LPLFYNQFLCRFKELYFSSFLKELDSKKVVQGGEYQNFLLNKKFFIHFFLSFKYSLRFIQIFYSFFRKTPIQPKGNKTCQK